MVYAQRPSMPAGRFVNLTVLNVAILFCEILTHRLEIHYEIVIINTRKFALIK